MASKEAVAAVIELATDMTPRTLNESIEAMARLIDAAVAAEREACALVCRSTWRELSDQAGDTTDPDDAATLRGESYGALECSKRIRARGAKPGDDK